MYDEDLILKLCKLIFKKSKKLREVKFRDPELGLNPFPLSGIV